MLFFFVIGLFKSYKRQKKHKILQMCTFSICSNVFLKFTCFDFTLFTRILHQLAGYSTRILHQLAGYSTSIAKSIAILLFYQNR